MPNPRVAVVVIFRNRTLYVDQCLEAIRGLEGGPWALVLVPDELVPEYEGCGIQAPLASGISQKRNAGVAAVPEGCEFVAFVDSDAYPRRDWLIRALDRLDPADARVAAVTGPALTPPDDPWFRKISGYAMASPLIMGREVSSNYDERLPVTAARNASTCNLVIRLAVLRQVGGFDERLRTSEDVALSDAIAAAGLTILRDPQVVVYHHRRDLVRFWLQWLNEGLALKQRRRFHRAGSLLVCLPSLLLIFEIVLAALGYFLVLGAMEASQLVVFLVERKRAGLSLKDAFGAAVAMWGFPKAYGLGGILSFLGGASLYLSSRNDPAVRGGPGRGTS